MNPTFQSKYPEISGLIQILDDTAKKAASLKSASDIPIDLAELAPEVLAYIPTAQNIGTEIQAIKSQPSDIVTACEELVTGLDFTAPQAKAAIDAIFALVEYGVGAIPIVTQALSAFKK